MIDQEALDELQDWNCGWRAALDSGLSDTYVPGEGGNPIAMIIGEAPGAQEEIKHRPFVGRAGIVLRGLMALAGLFATKQRAYESKEEFEPNCWLTNVVKFRPPRNRTPTKQEIEVARYGLSMEWRAIGKPTLIIPVGGVALHAVFGTNKMSIIKESGKQFTRRTTKGSVYTVWPMLHPSYVLRSNSTSLQRIVEKEWDELGRWIYTRDLVGAHDD